MLASYLGLVGVHRAPLEILGSMVFGIPVTEIVLEQHTGSQKGAMRGVLEGKRVSKCAHTRRGGVDSSNANSRLGPVVFIHTWLVLGQHPSRAEECFSDL